MTKFIGKLVIMDPSVPVKEQKSVASRISALSHASRPDGPGTSRRALLMGQKDPGALMPNGYTVGYDGEDLLMVWGTKHGRGLFTLVPIRANQIIIAGRGVLLSSYVEQTVEEQRYTWQPSPSGAFVFSQFVEEDANIMRFVNSSRGYGDAPNATLDWHVNMKMPFLRATRDILPAANGRKEILIDYSWDT